MEDHELNWLQDLSTQPSLFDAEGAQIMPPYPGATLEELEPFLIGHFDVRFI